MKVEQALHFIRPANAIFRRAEKGLRPEKGVHDDLTGLTEPGGLQCRIEPTKEVWWTRRASRMRMHHEIESGSADQIESGKVVSRTKNAGDGNVITPKVTKTIQQHFGWARTPGRVRESLARAGFVSLGEQLEPRFLRKRAQLNPAIRVAEQAVLEPFEGIRDGRIGESRLFGEFLRGQRPGLPEPVDDENAKNVEKGFRRSAHRAKSASADAFTDGLNAVLLDTGQRSKDHVGNVFAPDDEGDPLQNFRAEQGLDAQPFLSQPIVADLRFVEDQNAVKPVVHGQDFGQPHERRAEVTEIPQIGQDLKDTVPDQRIRTEAEAVSEFWLKFQVIHSIKVRLLN